MGIKAKPGFLILVLWGAFIPDFATAGVKSDPRSEMRRIEFMQLSIGILGYSDVIIDILRLTGAQSEHPHVKRAAIKVLANGVDEKYYATLGAIGSIAESKDIPEIQIEAIETISRNLGGISGSKRTFAARWLVALGRRAKSPQTRKAAMNALENAAKGSSWFASTHIAADGLALMRQNEKEQALRRHRSTRSENSSEAENADSH